MLQTLAAHMKLLLDTPEHLWRLIERKRYLHAGWLFLLARVIHRALVREDDEDDDGWATHGIDVLDQFPLVQRQWDTVAQFKSQIAYKATLSLRDLNASVEDTCSVLLILHLLESRPLPDILSTYLLQRTRSLQTSLSRGGKPATNGHPPQAPTGVSPMKARKTVVREVRESMEAVLDVISFTVGAARQIFRSSGPDDPSLMTRTLAFIQSDAPRTTDGPLPPELQMSTQYLLGSLPSASHFSILPPSIRMYKPYIDLTSSTSTVPATLLSEKLHQWFQTAVRDIQKVTGAWLSDLQSLAEVWDIRRWVHKWADSNAFLEELERVELLGVVDVIVHRQAAEIWRSHLSDMGHEFENELSSALSALLDGTNEGLLEASPANYLFLAPPSLSSFDIGAGPSGLASTFRKYESALRSRVAGRTPLLDKVLSSLEQRAEVLHKDLGAMQDDTDGQHRDVSSVSLKAYRPDAEEFCHTILQIVSIATEGTSGDSASSIRAFAFIGRVTAELSLSPFLSNVQHGTTAGSDFVQNLQALHDAAVDRWRNLTVGIIVARYREAWAAVSRTSRHSNSPPIPQSASPAVMQALLSISTSSHTIETSANKAQKPTAPAATLRQFVVTVLDDLDRNATQQQLLLWDLRFLRKLAQMWGHDWEDVSIRLGKRISKCGSDAPDVEDAILEHIHRTQVLLAPLLPPAQLPPIPTKGKKDGLPNGLLLHGLPTADKNVQPAMELVKPGPRFGLLLVGSTAVG
ncbi:hypothetical protein OF83DRAFT_1166839 [Amylostereum chailletii]|nr:hypothetical protein OF83DRAFT_1166839 [Amylostereum chailletii]